MTALRITPPFQGQCFTSHQQWVNKASSWLTRHPDYNNTEHGEKKGWRGNHFTALCFDSFGRRVRCGADFKKADEDGAFPVWWIWPDQICELVMQRAEALSAQSTDLSDMTAIVIDEGIRVERMWRAQRESFVRGMTTPCEHGVLDFEQCAECRKSGGEP